MLEVAAGGGLPRFTLRRTADYLELAKQLREAHRRGEELGLTEAEVAFYEALAENGTAVRVMANEALRLTARELVESVRSNATIDLALKETTRAKQGAG
jgi:type I restriction enzyme R subunit